MKWLIVLLLVALVSYAYAEVGIGSNLLKYFSYNYLDLNLAKLELENSF